MKNNSFGDLIWASIIRSWGPVFTFLGVALAITSFFLTPKTSTVELKWLLLILSLILLILVIFIRAAWDAYINQTVHLPKVMYVKEPPKAFPNSFALFLIEPTPIFSFGSLVSVYYLEDGVEKLIGVGEVINVQNDLKVQVLVHEDYDFGSKAEAIKNNSKDELDKLVLKPSIPGFLLENL